MARRVLRLSKSVVGRREADAVTRVLLEDGYLGMGREVQAFEAELAAYLGVPERQVACVNSGTAALHLAVQAVGEPGDEVLVQSLTFVASLQAVSAAGAVPNLCEVVAETVTIDLEDARRRISPRTKAIMPVHYASNPGDLDAIYAFAADHGLRVIEDAAHAFGCTYKGRKIGSFGDVACFSFDGIKNITCGEGGAVVCADRKVMDFVRDARLLGVHRDTEKRLAGERSWQCDVMHQGYRYHMSNIHAAIGRVQLTRLAEEFAPKRVRLAARYRETLASVPKVMLLEAELGAIVPHIQPIRVLEGRRDAVKDALEAAGIECGIHFQPGHILSFYGGGETELPITMQLYAELLTLPLHPRLTLEDVDRVCDVIAGRLND